MSNEGQPNQPELQDEATDLVLDYMLVNASLGQIKAALSRISQGQGANLPPYTELEERIRKEIESGVSGDDILRLVHRRLFKISLKICLALFKQGKVKEAKKVLEEAILEHHEQSVV